MGCHASKGCSVLSNLAARDVETVIHPYTNLATLREVGPLVIERGKGVISSPSRATTPASSLPRS
jgi:adenosylmethionine-8-amino-7-oxononanoate aminotransferase